MSLIARFFEEKGIPTSSVFLQKEMVRTVPAPRMLQVSWPFGHPYGDVGNRGLQAMVLRRLLDLASTADAFGYLDQPDWLWRRTEVDLPEGWGQVI